MLLATSRGIPVLSKPCLKVDGRPSLLSGSMQRRAGPARLQRDNGSQGLAAECHWHGLSLQQQQQQQLVSRAVLDSCGAECLRQCANIQFHHWVPKSTSPGGPDILHGTQEQCRVIHAGVIPRNPSEGHRAEHAAGLACAPD